MVLILLTSDNESSSLKEETRLSKRDHLVEGFESENVESNIERYNGSVAWSASGKNEYNEKILKFSAKGIKAFKEEDDTINDLISDHVAKSGGRNSNELKIDWAAVQNDINEQNDKLVKTNVARGVAAQRQNKPAKKYLKMCSKTVIIKKTPYQYTCPGNLDCTPDTKLFVLIVSKATDFAGRQTVRETWGTVIERRKDVSYAFVIGEPGQFLDYSHFQRNLTKELRDHKDVIQVDFLDTYRNLSSKSVTILHIARTFCRDASFMMKIDTDVFLNVDLLMDHLYNTSQTKTMIGYLQAEKRPMRAPGHKWHVSRLEFSSPIYPNYLSGTGYVMSMDLPPLLYAASLLVDKVFPMEDVFVTGFLAERAQVVRSSHEGFMIEANRLDIEAPWNFITLHPLSRKLMKIVWERFSKHAYEI